MLQREIIRKNMHLLFFHDESIHEVSRRYLIPEYHSWKMSVSKIYKKGQLLKIIIWFSFYFFTNHPLSADTSFKFLALKLLEILHLQNFISIFFQRAVIFQGEIIQK